MTVDGVANVISIISIMLSTFAIIICVLIRR